MNEVQKISDITAARGDIIGFFIDNLLETNKMSLPKLEKCSLYISTIFNPVGTRQGLVFMCAIIFLTSKKESF